MPISAITESAVSGELAVRAHQNAQAGIHIPIVSADKPHVCSECGKDDGEMCWRKGCIRPGAGA